jgi:probable phosphoglycerate mutase
VTDTAENAEQTEYRQHRFRLPPGATDILLVRHGESQPARADMEFPTKDGHADPPLDAHGHHEAQCVAARLADEDVAAIYVTPLQRTAQTAAPLASKLGLAPLIEPDLQEVFLGEWEGATFRVRVSEGHPLAKQLWEEQRWDVIPGAESMDELAERVQRGLNRIAAAHPDQRVVVFTHGGIIGTIMGLASGGRTFAFVGADNASISHIVVHDGNWILRRFNDTGHLATDLDRPSDPLM